MHGAMFLGLSALTILILLASTRKAVEASVGPGTFTSIHVANSSHLTVIHSASQRNPANCVNWCSRNFRGLCRIVLFDPKKEDCQRVLGPVHVSEPVVGSKQLFVRYRKRELIAVNEIF